MGLEPGEIPIFAETVQFDLHLPGERAVPGTHGAPRVTKVRVQRTGLPACAVFGISDWMSQGASFAAGSRILLHLNVPRTGPISRASLYVMLTRFTTWADLQLLRPLWRDGDHATRRHVIDRWTAACEVPHDVVAEQLLMALESDATLALLEPVLGAALVAAARAEPVGFGPEPP